MTWTVATLVMLPLCLLRDMAPLAGLSVVSVLSMIVIVGIVAYLYFMNPDDMIRHDGEGRHRDWFAVEMGYLECLGTFLFTFVSQHTVHMTFKVQVFKILFVAEGDDGEGPKAPSSRAPKFTCDRLHPATRQSFRP